MKKISLLLGNGNVDILPAYNDMVKQSLFNIASCVYFDEEYLGVIRKCISSGIADFFHYFLNPLPLLLSRLCKKFSKASFSNTQHEKCLNAKSSLKQVQYAHFHHSFR